MWPATALDWAKPLLGDRPILISATAPPEDGRGSAAPARPRAGRRTGRGDARGDRPRPRGKGARRFVVAGGETAGAVVQALGVTGLRIGRADRPRRAVDGESPASLGEPALALALKSGNFGAPDFFLRAFAVLERRWSIKRFNARTRRMREDAKAPSPSSAKPPRPR